MLPFEHRELLIQGRRSGMVVLSTIGLLYDQISYRFVLRVVLLVQFVCLFCHFPVADFKKLWPRSTDPKVFKNPVISLATSQGQFLLSASFLSHLK